MNPFSGPGAASSSGSRAYAHPDHEHGHTVWGTVKEGVTSSSSSNQGSVASVKPEKKIDNVLILDEWSNTTTSSSSEGPPSSQDATSKRWVDKEDDDSVPDEFGLLTNPSSKDPESRLLEAELLKKVPWLDGQPLSVGSIPHDSGTCAPCAFSQRPKGCKQGLRCEFCHYDHPEYDHKASKQRCRPRPCKGKRMRFKSCVDKYKALLEEDEDFDPEAVDLPPSIAEDSTRSAKLIMQLKEHKQAVEALRTNPQSNKLSL